MKSNAGLGARLRALSSSRRRRSTVNQYATQIPFEPLEGRMYLDALPAWVNPGSSASWNAATHTLEVNGATTITADPGTDAPLVHVSGSGANLTIQPNSDTPIHVAGLSLAEGATATTVVGGYGPASAAHRVLVVGSGGLAISPDSTLDLGSFALVVRGGEHAAVADSIASGFYLGDWLGTGITSSAARGDVTGRTALGSADAGEIGVSSFKGESVAAGDVLVRYTYVGDADLSGDVSIADLLRFNTGYTAPPEILGTWASGDTDYSGKVDAVDFRRVMTGFAATNPSLLDTDSESTASGTGESAGDLPVTPAEDLPDWLSSDSMVNWDAATGTLTVLGGARIVADPGNAVAQHVLVDGGAAVLTIENAVDSADLANTAVVHIGSLSITGGGRVTVASVSGNTSSNRRTLVVHGSATIDSTSKLDLRDNALILKSSSESAVKAWVTAGFHGGDWLGAGGIASGVAAQDVHHLTALGYAANASLNKTSFANVDDVSSTDVFVNFAPQGDADLDGQATLDDFTLFMGGYQSSPAGDTWIEGDFDYSGTTTDLDSNVFAASYNNITAEATSGTTIAVHAPGEAGDGVVYKVYGSTTTTIAPTPANLKATSTSGEATATDLTPATGYYLSVYQYYTYYDEELEQTVTTRTLIGRPNGGLVPIVMPKASISGNASVAEGTAYALSLSAVGMTPTGWTINWGDGSDPDGDSVPGQLITGNPASFPHTYLDGPATYTVTASATTTTPGGPYQASPIQVQVTNAAPDHVTISGPTHGTVGDPLALTGSATDPAGDADVLTFAWSLSGPGISSPLTGSGTQYSFTPTDAGTYTLELTADDGDGGVTTRSLDIVVDPLPAIRLRLPGTEDYVAINDGFSEGNTDSHGAAAPDNKPDYSAGQRADIANPKLRAAQVALNGTPGTWKLSYPDRVMVWRVAADGQTLIAVPSDPAAPGIAASDPAGEVVDLRIEGLRASNSLDDAGITATFTPSDGSGVIEDQVHVTVGAAGWTIDGDNDNGTDTPDYTDAEAAAARDPSATGKSVYIDDGSLSAGGHFVPVTLLASRPYDLSVARFHVVYAADDPLGVGPTGGPLRLWKKDGSAARDGRSADLGGDFVAAGEYSAAELGINTSSRQANLWMEAVSATTGLADPNRKVELFVDPDGTAGPAGFVLTDAVYVTASPVNGAVGSISGYKWEDVNRDGIRNYSATIEGSHPKVVYVIDVSGSTKDQFVGNSISQLTTFDPNDDDDTNDDGIPNSILDGEIAGVLSMNNALVQSGFAAQTEASVVIFGHTATAIDLDMDTAGNQSVMTLDAAGLAKVTNALKHVHAGGHDVGARDVGLDTYYRNALLAASDALGDMAPAQGDGNVIFMSDGYPDDPDNYADVAAEIRGAQVSTTPLRYEVNLRAYGAGREADPDALQAIQQGAQIYITSDQLLGAFSSFSATSGGDPLEWGLGNWSIFADINGDGLWEDGEPGDGTDGDGNYTIANLAPGTYTIREAWQNGWTQSFPATVTRTVTVHAGVDERGPDGAGYNFGNYQGRPDLDVDSDNSGTLDRSATEDDIEDGTGQSGKHVTIHDGDADDDGVPDMLDLDVDGQQFVPMVLDVGEFVLAYPIKINLAYDGSDPADIHGIVPPASGTFRIWTKPGDQPRTASDYVDPTKFYTPAELGFDLDHGTTQVTFWVEGVRPTPTGHKSIVATIDQNNDGIGATDTVNVTIDADAAPNQAPYFTAFPQDLEHVSLNPDAPPPLQLPPSAWAVGDVFLTVGKDIVRRFSVNAAGELEAVSDLDFSMGAERERAAGLTFDRQGSLFVDGFLEPRVGHFLPNGQLTADVKGFIDWEEFRPEGLTVDDAGNLYVGSEAHYQGFGQLVEPAFGIVKFDAQGREIASYLPQRAADRISLATDQHTVYFTREIDPDDTDSARKIYRMDLNGVGEPQPVFASADPASYFGDLRALPDGSVLVADIGLKRVLHVHADGQLDALVYGEGLDDFGAISLDPDGRSFWTASTGHEGVYTAKLYRFDLASGRLIQFVDVGELFPAPSGNTELAGIAVYGEPSAIVRVDQAFEAHFTARDPDGDPVVYSFVGDSHGATIDPVSGAFTWRPTKEETVQFTVRASDPDGLFSDHTFSIQAQIGDPTNTPPVIDTQSLSGAFVGSDYQNRIVAHDDDGDRLTYKLVNTPNATIDPDTGMLKWRPEASDRGTTKDVTVQVTDARGSTAEGRFTIAVADWADDNADPIYNGSAFTAVVDEPFEAEVPITDPPPNYSGLREYLVSGPTGLTLNLDYNVWRIRWTPTSGQVGIQNVVIRAMDGRGGVTQATIPIVVNNTGRHMFFEEVNQLEVDQGQSIGQGVLAHMHDVPDALGSSSTADQFEAWVTCDGVVGRATLGPGVSTGPQDPARIYPVLFDHVFDKPGSYPLSIYVRHSTGATVLARYTVKVKDLRPTGDVAGIPVDATKGVQFSGRVGYFIDPDPNGQPQDWKASVDWGDGTFVPADSIERAEDGGFYVVGYATYGSLGNNIDLDANGNFVGHYTVTIYVQPTGYFPNASWIAVGVAPVRVHPPEAAVASPGPIVPQAVSPERITLTWPVPSNIAGYVVYRENLATHAVMRDPESGSEILDVGVNQQEFAYTDGQYATGPLDPHTTYQYSVYAVDVTGNVSTPTVVSETTLDNLPPPEILDPDVESGTHVQVKWRLPENQPTLAGWDVLRADKEAGPFTSILPPGKMVSGLPVFDDETTEPQTAYWYKVVAIDDQGRRSSPSEWKKATTGAAPGVPIPATNLQAAYGGFARVGLKWDHAPSAGLLGFDVYRDTSADFTPSLSTRIGSSADPRYTDDNVVAVNGVSTFYYKVVAVSDGGTSLPSNVASVDLLATIPSPGKPSGLKAESVNVPYVDHNHNPQVLQRDHNHVSWDDNTLLETGYDILRSFSDDGGSTWSVEEMAGRATADATSFDDKDVVSWFRYRYRVRAVNESGTNTSDEVAEVLADDGAVSIGRATNLRVIEDATTPLQVSLTWDNASGTEYVYRSTDGGAFVRLNEAPLPIGSTTFVDNTVEPSTSYSYIVRVLDTAYHRVTLPSNQCDWTTDPAEDSVPVGRITSPVSIGNPSDPTPAQITAATEVRGIVDDLDANFTGWTLLLRPVNVADQSAAAADIVLRSGTQRMGSGGRDGNDLVYATDDALLFTLDPSLYPSGAYDLVLQGKDWPQGGNGSMDLRTTELGKTRVQLSSEIKLGNLTLPFTDLSVNVPGGQPVTVTRVYDSSTADVLGDFGYGWRLDLNDADVRTTGRPSHRSDDGAKSTPVLRQGDLVYITLPGGDQRTFAFIPRPLSYDPAKPNVYYTYAPQFVAVDGSRATLTVDTDGDGGPWELRRDGDEFFAIGTEFAELGYNPARTQFGAVQNDDTRVSHYYLSTEDGIRYVVNATTGKILTSTDPNGNETNYDPADTTGVTIHRNAAGRVDWVADKRYAESDTEHHVEYHYYSEKVGYVNPGGDASKRLWKVIDNRTGAVTEFLYEESAAHPNRLTGIIDPRGVQTLDASYSPATGELSSISGPASPEPAKIASGGFDGTRATQVVTDLAGNTTEMVYDKHGNVAREIKHIPSTGPETPEKWLVTVKDYRFITDSSVDAVDTGVTNYNLPSDFKEWAPFEIDGPDVEGARYTQQPSTLPVRKTNFYSFDPQDTNPNDPNAGFPLSTSVLNINYDPNGADQDHPERQYLTTHFGDYFKGKPGTVTDPYGRTTRTTFDSSGNVLTTIGPDGEGSEFVYSDSLLRPDLPKGLLLQTWRVYDDDNDPTTRPVRLRNTPDAVDDYYASGALRGLLKTSTDVSGRVTAFAYDALGRLTHTATRWDNPAAGQPDRWVVSRSVYDDAGRVTSNTETTYNDVGTAGVFDWSPDTDGNPVINETVYSPERTLSQTSYDVMGQVSTTTDGYGGVTISRYDDRGQLVQTEYPDGTISQSVYDVMGRVILSVDRFKPGQTVGSPGTELEFAL